MQQQGGAEQPYFDLLRTQSRLPVGSTVLGYELVGAEWTLDFHSWHCHGYAAEAFDELRVQLNEFGLIDNYEQATRVLTWMLRQPPENQPHRSNGWLWRSPGRRSSQRLNCNGDVLNSAARGSRHVWTLRKGEAASPTGAFATLHDR